MMYNANKSKINHKLKLIGLLKFEVFLGISPSDNLDKPSPDYQEIPDSLGNVKSLL